MKADLDSLMQAQSIDALLVVGSAPHNPAMYYFTGGGHVSHAVLVKRRGEAPVLFHNAMERDEATKSGLTCISFANYPYLDLLKEAGNDPLKAQVLRYQRMLADLDLTTGKVMLYGTYDVGNTFAVLNAVQEALPGLIFTGDVAGDILMQAMATKDEAEIARIRQMGEITTRVVAQTAGLLSSLHALDGVLVKADGQPMTIGEVKSRINLWIAEQGAENPEDTIFAIGRDAGVPHSSGNPEDVLRLGQTIVYDIFPCEKGGGYFYDFTRTWCLGYAPDEAQSLYDQVRKVYQQVTSEFATGIPTTTYQVRTCELFEAQGHKTVRSHPETEEGYVHSLGHGVGLNIHEKPAFRMSSSTETLQPGAVFTVEPGLYYPERGMGVRLENTWYVKPDGTMAELVPYPMDLVLPVRKVRGKRK